MERKLTGQTSMILIVLMIILFMGLGIFLLMSSIKPEFDEYHNLYAHSLLLSVLRRNTGYGGYCDTISSTVSCAYMTSYRNCGEVTCKNLSAEIMPELIGKVIKETYDYCMIIEPETNQTYETEKIVYGPRCDVVRSKRERWVANEKILQHDANLNIQMIITRK